MKKGLLIGLAVVLLSIMQSPARGQDEPTLTELHKVLRDRGARWEAGETSMNKLSHEERKARLGLGMTRPTMAGYEHKRRFLVSAVTSTGEGTSAPLAAPPTFDWRNNGGNYVTPVRNQGGCGSCWAFASTAALESAILRYRQTPNVDLNLSEQVLLSCSGAGNCEQGGGIGGAAEFMKNYGLPPESYYPYTATDGACASAGAGWQSYAEKISDWSYIGQPGTVDELKDAVYNHGPLTVTMAVYSDFFSYSGGVYHHVSGGLAGYHAILLVGYDDANQCFIVKNSWGAYWGEQGFFRIAYSEVTGDSDFGNWAITYTAGDSNCSYTSKIDQSGAFPGTKATGTATVTTTSGCSWQAVSTTGWIKVTAGNTGRGSGTVAFSLDDNTAGGTRGGTIRIAGQDYTIYQNTACAATINPTSQSFTTAGGSGSVAVTCASTCSRTATSNASWITVTSGASGQGNGTVVYSVPANTGPARAGSITIAGNSFIVSQAGSTCTFSITPTSQSLTASAGGGTVNVTSPSGCAWAASSSASWLTITSGASGTGNGSVVYSVTANTGSSSRSGFLTIAGNAFSVTQAAGSTCTSTITPTSQNLTGASGSGAVSVTAPSGCAWTAVSNASWINITSGASGSGNGSVGYSVAANTGTSSRNGTLTIGGNTFTVTQAGGTCTASISPTSQNFVSSAGTGTVSVTSPSGCAWTASSNASFISITSGASGTGNGSVGYSVTANTTTAARSGSLTIAGQTHTVSQAAASCTYAISPTSNSLTAAAGTGSVTVSSASGCAWTAASNASWIGITSEASSSGNGTVGYRVSENRTGFSRTGTMTIAGQTFTVNQATASCTYAISPASQSLGSAAGTGSVSVTSSSGCAWTASSNASFISITSGASGSGNGTVGYSVTANTTTAARSGSLTIAGQTFTVNQTAAACTYAISPASNSLTAAASTGSVSVSSASGCAWTAASNASSWLTITSGSSGTGNGSVGYSAAANTSGSSRTGTLTIGGQSFSVTQAGQSCSYNISPTSQSYAAAGGTGSAYVYASSGCPWTATSGASWISITSGASGSGNGPVSYSVTNNTGSSVRQGTMTIAGSTFTVNQTGLSCSYAVTPTDQGFAGTGGTGSVSVSAPSGCAWTAASNANWLIINAGTSGSGSGTVSYTVNANTTQARRSAVLTIGGGNTSYPVTIIESGGQACTYSISPTGNSFTAAAGTGSVGVTSTSGCAWTASSNASWISITSGLSGTGNGTVGYSVTANTTTAARSGTLTIAGQTFTVSQAAPSCTYAISPASNSFTAAAGTGSIGVTSTSGCAWTAASGASWISITSGASGSGSGTVGYSVTANTTTAARSGTLTVAGKTFTVSQAAPSCTYAISPASNSFTAAAGTGSIGVTSTSGCAWTAASGASWISITSGASGSGSGTVGYSVTANTTTAARSGTLTVAGKTFTVSQAAATCTYSISPTSNSFSSSAGSGSVSVSSGCAWTATSNNTSWLTITSGASGSGNGSVGYAVTANTGTTSRSGTLTIAGSTFTVTQAAAATCTFSITPTTQTFTGATGTGTVSVTSASGCGWTATSNASWITITSGASGSGNGTVGYSVAANTTAARSGTLTVAGRTVTVNQAASNGCTYDVSPVSQSFTAIASVGSVGVNCNRGCDWTATSNAPWITITSGASGSRGAYVTYATTANTGASRTGTLTVAGKTVTVTQAGGPSLSVSTTALGFGTIAKGTSSAQPVTVSNTGTGDLTVTSVTVDTLGGSVTSFSQSHNCNTVSPKGSCTINVKFSPGGPGAKSTYLYIYSNGGTAKVPLTGTAQ